MKAMLLGFAAAALIALGAGVVLNATNMSSAERYSGQSVRL